MPKITASKILELTLGTQDFVAVDVGAMAPRVRRASIHMEAMGLWRPSHITCERLLYGPLVDMSYYVVLPVLWRSAVLAASGVMFRQIIAWA